MKIRILLVVYLIISVGFLCQCQKRYDKTLTNDLVVAVLNKNLENTKSLLARNADPNAVDEKGTPLLMAVLLRVDFDFNEAVSGTISGDKKASTTQQIVKLLLDAGANANAKDKQENPVLMAAFARQDPGIVADLIRAGADVNAFDSSGSPLIIEAVYSGKIEIVELMVDAGANINEKSKNGLTALLFASNRQKWEISKFLIQKNADVNAQMDVGTPLIFAVAAGNLEIVKLLVDKGADVNAKDKENDSPLSIAQDRKLTQIADFLKTAGAKP